MCFTTVSPCLVKGDMLSRLDIGWMTSGVKSELSAVRPIAQGAVPRTEMFALYVHSEGGKLFLLSWSLTGIGVPEFPPIRMLVSPYTA